MSEINYPKSDSHIRNAMFDLLSNQPKGPTSLYQGPISPSQDSISPPYGPTFLSAEDRPHPPKGGHRPQAIVDPRSDSRTDRIRLSLDLSPTIQIQLRIKPCLARALASICSSRLLSLLRVRLSAFFPATLVPPPSAKRTPSDVASKRPPTVGNPRSGRGTDEAPPNSSAYGVWTATDAR